MTQQDRPRSNYYDEPLPRPPNTPQLEHTSVNLSPRRRRYSSAKKKEPIDQTSNYSNGNSKFF